MNMRTQLSMVAVGIGLTVAASMSWRSVALADTTQCCGNPIRWNTTVVTIKMHPAGFPSGTAQRARFVEAAQQWTNVIGSNFIFTTISDDENNMDNNENEAFWLNTAPNNSTPAETALTYHDGCGFVGGCCTGCTPSQITQTDIRFYNNFQNGTPISWSNAVPEPLVNSSGPSTNHTVLVASHELGHAAGILHSNNGMARMESALPAGGWLHNSVQSPSRITPFAQDAAELRVLYPDNSTGSRLYAANMCHDPTAGDHNLSGNSQGLAYNPANDQTFWFPRNRTPIPGRLPREIRVGQIADVQVCYGNRGVTASAAGTLTIRLSTDTTLGSDTTAATFGLPSQPGYTSGCFVVGFTVPSVTARDYFVLYDLGTGAEMVSVVNQQLSVIP